MQTQSFVVKLSKFSILLALCVIILGAYTRLSDAGLGCPDWPGCYGHITVPKTDVQLAKAEQHFPGAVIEARKAWIEMIHRYIAGFLGLICFALFFIAWTKRKQSNAPFKLSLFLVLLICFQAALGMWTVTLTLLPIIVVAHLLGGMATLVTLVLIYLRWAEAIDSKPLRLPARVPFLAFAGLLVVVGQIFLGGWTSTNYAALACPDFPTCQQQWLPPLDIKGAFDLIHPTGINYEGGTLDNDARVTIHLAHRVGAIITLVMLGMLIISLVRTGVPTLNRFAATIGLLLLLQLSLGIGNIVLHLPISVAVTHNAIAAVLLVSLVVLNAYLMHSPQKRFA